MKLTALIAPLLGVVMFGTAVTAPVNAEAQSHRSKAATHRQKTKNTWRNVAIGSAAVGAYGLVTHQNGLAAAGIAGAAYGATRYEHDRKSQNRIQHGHHRRTVHHRRRHHVRHHH